MFRKQSIDVSLPRQFARGDGSVDIRPGAFAEWLESLPLANVGETARRVYHALYESNRLRFTSQDRYRALELLQEVLAFLHQALQQRFADSAFPLDERTRLTAELSFELHSETGLGYKIAIRDVVSGSLFGGNKAMLSVMLHRALRALSRALLVNSQLYAPIPERVWQDIHRLYQYAEQNLLHHTPVEEGDGREPGNIATVYKQILLFAAANPHRLRADEMASAYESLGELAALSQLKPYQPVAGERGDLFVVSLDQDRPPQRAGSGDTMCNETECRLLEITVPPRPLNGDGVPAREGALDANLYRRLALGWGLPPGPREPRSATEQPVEVVLGLSRLHRSLAMAPSSTAIEQLFSPPATFATRAAWSGGKATNDPWKRNLAGTQSQAPRQPSPPTEAAPPETATWTICDRASGGYRVLVNTDDTPPLRIGELVGLRMATGEPWQPAAVRWMRETAHDRLGLGLQLLSNECRLAAARPRANGAGEYQRCLLLLAESTERLGELILPARLFTEGSLIELWHEEASTTIRLREMEESGTGFSLFRYSTEETGTPLPPPEQGEEEDRRQRFNKLWSRL